MTVHNHETNKWRLLLVGFFILFISPAYGILDPATYLKWSGSSIAPVSPPQALVIYENNWPIISNPQSQPWNFVNKAAYNEVIFSMDPDMVQPTSAYYAEVDLAITYQDENLSSITINKTLQINYEPSGGAYTARSYVHFENGYHVSIEVQDLRIGPDLASLSTPATVPDYLRIEARVQAERYYHFDRSAVSHMTAYTKTSPPGNPWSGKLEVTWASLPGAESYDLEYMYVDDYGDNPSDLQVKRPLSDIEFDFRRNGTRLNLSRNSHTFHLAHDRGHLLFRVRGIGYVISDPSQKQEGVWSLPNSGVLSSYSTPPGSGVVPYFPLSEAHQASLNWQHNLAIAEDGLTKDVIGYFDAVSLSRQTVTVSNSQNQAIVQENIPDAQHRPVIQVLPSPLQSDVLTFYSGITVNDALTPVPYSWQDFDTDGTNCDISVGAMGTSSGASHYYSPANTDKQGAQGYVPDAQKFPFRQVQHMPDPTGRIKAQGGPGPDHKIGSGHETRMYYTDVFQEELNQLFGTDAGYAEHYKKVITMDGNGQMSASITDAVGNVVATYLMGESPESLEALASNTGPETLVIDLSQIGKPTQSGDGIKATMDFFASSPGDHIFNYSLEGAMFQDNCMISTVCFDCTYDLVISITDECGAEMIPNGPITETIPSLSNLDESCGVATLYEINQLTLNLDVGNYTITKTLLINEAGDE